MTAHEYETIFSNPFAQTILVFVLVFTIIFAVLQKTKILGEGKKQVDALAALAMGLLVIGFGYALDIITRLIPVLGVALVVILVFLILLGIFYKEGSFEIPSGVKIFFGILVFLLVIIAVFYITGTWEYIIGFFAGNVVLVSNIILIAIIIAAVWLVVSPGRGGAGR